MKTIKESQLSAELKQGLSRLYLVCGDDVYTSDKSVSMILAALKKTDADDPLKFEYPGMSDDDFDSLSCSVSFFGSRRSAVIDNFKPGRPSEDRMKLLEGFFSDIPDDLTVILKYVDTDSYRFSVPKTITNLVGLCRDSVTVNCIVAQLNIRREIASMAKEEGCTITDRAVTMLVELLGDDLMALRSEIKKLAAYSRFTEIGESHVKDLSPRSLEDNVFGMISAIEAGNTARALSLAKDMLDSGVDPLGILALVNTSFINYYRCALASREGKSAEWIIENYGYKKGDRMLTIAFDKCRKYKVQALEKMIRILYDLDFSLKSSRVDRDLLLEKGIMELVLAVKNQ